jgi:hypothetical protein
MGLRRTLTMTFTVCGALAPSISADDGRVTLAAGGRAIIFAVILALLIVTLASPIAAGPVNYDEAVGGDLPDGRFGILPTFTLDVVVNTISGTFSVRPGGFEPDFDSFAFIVPAGTHLVAAQIELTDDMGDVGLGVWDLYSGSAVGFGGTLVEQLISFSPGADTVDTVPLGPGIYNFTQTSVGDIGTPELHSADYTFTLTLRSAVPEPATLAFLALGLAGLIVVRRRRHRS